MRPPRLRAASSPPLPWRSLCTTTATSTLVAAAAAPQPEPLSSRFVNPPAGRAPAAAEGLSSVLRALLASSSSHPRAFPLLKSAAFDARLAPDALVDAVLSATAAGTDDDSPAAASAFLSCLLSSLSRAGRADAAADAYSRMAARGVFSDVKSRTDLIVATARCASAEDALALFAEMRREGYRVDVPRVDVRRADARLR